MSGMSSLEFNLNIRDLSVAEILQQTTAKDVLTAMEDVRIELGKIDIEVEAIKVPLQLQAKKFEEVAENITASLKVWENKIADKKAEIVVSESDFSEYESAFALANAEVNEDIQAQSVASAKQANTMRL